MWVNFYLWCVLWIVYFVSGVEGVVGCVGLNGNVYRKRCNGCDVYVVNYWWYGEFVGNVVDVGMGRWW